MCHNQADLQNAKANQAYAKQMKQAGHDEKNQLGITKDYKVNNYKSKPKPGPKP